ncbi:MAG: hypothetical protein LQ345_004723 [Seirophora villosa]|nr:MAG: hypothetical protein LQ345_004723 [Seirophora villosa]
MPVLRRVDACWNALQRQPEWGGPSHPRFATAVSASDRIRPGLRTLEYCGQKASSSLPLAEHRVSRYGNMVVFKRVAAVLSALLLICHTNAGPATPPDDGKPLVQQVANISRARLLVHPHFSLVIQDVKDARVGILPLLLNAVNALYILALRIPTGVSPATRFHLPRYPDLDIDLLPTRRSRVVMNEAALLCVYHGIEDMVRRQDFRLATFKCYWDNVSVTKVNIISVHGTVGDEAAEPSVPDSTANLTVPSVGEFTPRFAYFPSGLDLDMQTVFITVMHALVCFGRKVNDARVGHLYTDPGPEWDASLLMPMNEPPPRHPPFLVVEWVIKALRQVPAFMLQNRRFAELGITFDVDRVNLGTAILQKGKANVPDSDAAVTTA